MPTSARLMNLRKLKLINIIACAVMGISGFCFSAQAQRKATAIEMDLKFLARLFVQAEETTELPRHLLAAIASRESSFWPWSLNIAGRSYYLRSKKAVLEKIKDCNSYDLGLMQINSMWLSRFGVSAEEALDPATNVLLGSTILMDCIDRHGILGGIACYHAGDPISQRGVAYAEKIIAVWRDLKGFNDDSTPGPGK